MNSNRVNEIKRRLDRLDARIAGWMARNGVACVRISLGIVFLWFGALKLVPGLSPAEDLAGQTILALTNGLIKPAVSIPLLGIWETLIGIGLLSGKALRATLVLLFAQMAGTVTPLVLFPSEVFVTGPFVPTMVGQYIIKNIVLVSAAIVVGATVRGGRLKAEATGNFSSGLIPAEARSRLSAMFRGSDKRLFTDGKAVDGWPESSNVSTDSEIPRFRSPKSAIR
jgi:uncharacterized membrane protein YkgB